MRKKTKTEGKDRVKGKAEHRVVSGIFEIRDCTKIKNKEMQNISKGVRKGLARATEV